MNLDNGLQEQTLDDQEMRDFNSNCDKKQTEEIVEDLYDAEDKPKPARDDRTPQPELQQEPKPAADLSMSDGLTDQEIRERDQVLEGARRLQEFDRAFVKKYGTADVAALDRQIKELAKTDKGRAAAMRSDVREELAARQEYEERVTGTVRELRGRVTERKRQSAHSTGRAKLLKEAPELKDEAIARQFSKYLLTRYTAQEIENCLDPRPLIGEYKAWRAANPAPKKTVRRPGAKRNRRTNANGRTHSPGTMLAADFYGNSPPEHQTSTTARRKKDDPVAVLYGS